MTKNGTSSMDVPFHKKTHYRYQVHPHSKDQFCIDNIFRGSRNWYKNMFFKVLHKSCLLFLTAHMIKVRPLKYLSRSNQMLSTNRGVYIIHKGTDKKTDKTLLRSLVIQIKSLKVLSRHLIYSLEHT